MDVTIEEYAGPHRDLEWSFRLAEDSDQQLDSYIDLGRVWVARAPDGEVVGHLQAVGREKRPLGGREHRRRGARARVTESAAALLEHVIAEARAAGVARVILATATADIGNLRFYQRCGFRMTHVVPDAFGPFQGYPPGMEVDGIPMLDQVWFERVL